jgi:hypothetical protein
VVHIGSVHPGVDGRPARPRSTHVRIALAALAALLSGVALAACGGSSVSDAVPKSTPDITPPANTSAEKAAVQTTSTTTTATKSTPTTGTTGESAPAESEKHESTEAGSGEASAGAGGGTAATEKEKEAPKAEAKPESKESSPTGGASAP